MWDPELFLEFGPTFWNGTKVNRKYPDRELVVEAKRDGMIGAGVVMRIFRCKSHDN